MVLAIMKNLFGTKKNKGSTLKEFCIRLDIQVVIFSHYKIAFVEAAYFAPFKRAFLVGCSEA